VELKWLEDFLSLAETRSFSRSASERNVTQPAFSRRIRALEAWLGSELVDRSAYPTSLTPAGRLFRDVAEDVLRKLQESRATLRGQQRLPENVVQVAAAHTLSLTVFPGWLARVESGFGPLATRLVATNVHDAVLALVEGGADLLLGYHHPRLPLLLDSSRFAFVALGTDVVLPVSVADGRGHPRYRLPGSRAHPLPYLSYSLNAFLGRTVELILQSAPETPYLERRYVTDMAEGIKAMALEGRGIAWVPESSAGRELGEKRLLPAGGEKWRARLEIRLYCSLENRKPVVRKLWDWLNRDH
jgi:DNA-binding transcriptional LysR family regulator